MYIVLDIEKMLQNKSKAQVLSSITSKLNTELDTQIARQIEEEARLKAYNDVAARVANNTYTITDIEILREELDRRKAGLRASVETPYNDYRYENDFYVFDGDFNPPDLAPYKRQSKADVSLQSSEVQTAKLSQEEVDEILNGMLENNNLDSDYPY